MQNVSFKGIYEIPVNQNKQNYSNFIKDTMNLKNNEQQTYLCGLNDNYYVYIRDENDKKFENYALRYGINYRKTNETKVNNLKEIDNQITPAAKDLNFLYRAIRMGIKHEITKSGDKKEVILYDDKGKNIFSTYNIQESPEQGIKLIKKTEFLDGKTDCIHEYDNNGKYSHTIMLYGDGSKLEFLYDNGRAVLKK